MTHTHDIEHESDSSDEVSTSPADMLARGRVAVRVLEDVVGPVVATMGFVLVHLEWAATARPRVLRLYLDREGGMTLDDCARLSPILSNALDAAEHGEDAGAAALRAVLEVAYVLEVSSPGVERPLSRRSQFDLHVGARATVRTHAPVVVGSPQKTFHGRIVATSADPIGVPGPGALGPVGAVTDDRDGSVSLADEDGTVHEIPLSLIRRANLVYEPAEAPQTRTKPGARSSGRGGPVQQKAVDRG